MKRMNVFVLKLLGAAVILNVGVPVVTAQAAPTTLAAATITNIDAGWYDPQVLVKLNIPFTNPQACPNTDGYVTDPSLSGTQLFNAFLMTAFSQNRQVAITIDGCVIGRPKIIGVSIRP